MSKPKPSRRIAAIEEVYARLPEIQCKGLCYDSCGPIAMTSVERWRIRGKARLEIRVVGLAKAANGGIDLRCSALTDNNLCSVYAIRPAICRLWGLTEALQCSYGCVPEGGYLTEVEAYTFLADVAHAAGEARSAERFRRVANDPNCNTEMVFKLRRGELT